MSYFTFKNGETPLNDTNLNNMQDAIKSDLDSRVDVINGNIQTKYIKATITTPQTVSTNYKINFDRVVFNNSKFELEDGKIKIPAGVNRVRVSGTMFVDGWVGGTASVYLWGKILKNNTPVTTSIAGSTAFYLSSTLAATIVEVQEGDLISMMADSGSGGTLRTGEGDTFLLVEELN